MDEQARISGPAFDTELAGLAAGLIRAPVDTIDARIVKTVGAVGEMLDADRAHLLRQVPEQRRLVRTHQWTRPGTVALPEEEPLDAFPWLTERVLEAGKLVTLSSLDELPPEAAQDRLTLERNGVRSGAVTPLVLEDRVIGGLTFASVTREQRWTPDLVSRLLLVGEVVASAIARRDVELALRSTLLENERLRERLAAENVYLHEELVEVQDFGDIIGRSAPLRSTMAMVRQVAGTDAPVLLLGETGTGKELLARTIHAEGHRRSRPFIAVNCAAMPATLIESEFFGHERGAFTGADRAKPGRFELAHGGTLFLDEIGELDPSLQTKLLRALQDGDVQRLGSGQTRKVDVRVIAATNRDVHRDMREGRFRSDLYYRLGVFPIEVPPLRDRREDIPLLVWHFIQSRQAALHRHIEKIPKAAMAALEAYDWPGNIRELQNVIERALILSRGSTLAVEEALGPTSSQRGSGVRPGSEALKDAERAHILRILERYRWVIEGRGQAAEALGINPSTLRHRMRRLGVRRPSR